jgi:thiol-disulfide isomerase/thioredoxin
MKHDIALTAIVSMLLFFAIILSFASNSVNGQNAPDFHPTDLSNNQHSLSEYQGSIVVLDFFSVNCSECQVSAKNVLVPLYDNSSSGDAKVQFLSVETTGATADAINSTYVNSTGITWPVLTGGDNLINSYSTNGIPTAYVIDPAGKIVVSMAHPLNIETLRVAIDNLLSASTNATSTTIPDTTILVTPTPSAPSPSPTATPSTSPTLTPTSSDAILNAHTSDTSEAILNAHPSNTSIVTQSRDPAAASPLAPSKSVASSSTSSDTQKENSSSAGLENCSLPLGLENCSLPLTQQASLCNTSQKCLLYSSSMLSPIVPSTVLTQAAAMSAEASALSQNTIPAIALPAQTNGTASLPLQSVYEFSLLGLGAPTLLIGVLYLLLRRV